MIERVMFMDYYQKSDASLRLQMKYEPNFAVVFFTIHSFTRFSNIMYIRKR